MTAISVVVPVYGNAGTLPELHRRIAAALPDEDLELILVDDASPDGSAGVIEGIRREDPRVRAIANERNLGQHQAVMRGLREARGRWTVVMDADLQDPPEAIPLLLGRAAGGHDVVFAGRRGRYESLPRLLTGRVFKRLLARGSGVPPDAGMFFVASEEAVRNLVALEGPEPFVVAMIGRVGLDSVSVPVARSRPRGPSGYSFAARLRSALRGLRWALTAPRRAAPAAAGAAPRIESHNEAQREYYKRAKPGMAPRQSRYLARHVDELVAFAALEPGARVLEVGPGQGRYTLPLADRGFRVEGLELAPAMLEALDAERGDRQIELHEGDVISPPSSVRPGFDAVVGFFALHHMHDVSGCLRAMTGLLAPGGRLAMLEPNPYNPLYYVQMAITPEMTWRGDRGMLGMRPRPLLRALEDAGLEDRRFTRFGFFPPFIADRPRAAAVEQAIERVPPLRPVLPFQLLGGRRPCNQPRRGRRDPVRPFDADSGRRGPNPPIAW